MSPITINFMSEELWEAHKPENLQTSHTDTEKDKPEHNHCWLSQELHLSIYQLLRPTEKMTKHALNILFSCCGKLTLKTLIVLKISRVQILHLRDCEASKLTQTHKGWVRTHAARLWNGSSVSVKMQERLWVPGVHLQLGMRQLNEWT